MGDGIGWRLFGDLAAKEQSPLNDRDACAPSWGDATRKDSASGQLLAVHFPIRGGRTVPLYELTEARSGAVPPWQAPLYGPAVAIIDERVANLPSTRRLLAALGNADIPLHLISVSESRKTWADAERVLRFLSANIHNEHSTILCIGGGVLINLAGFAASVFLRGRVPTIYVPTTTTALADVVIGNKTAVNGTASDGIVQKHVVGSYFEPTAILVDRAFLEREDDLALVEGCAELLKHGVVQSADLLRQTMGFCRSPEKRIDELFRQALQCAALKASALQVDYEERGIGRILQYGHLHAHGLERASNFGISHNLAVWCGVYLDLCLAGDSAARSIGIALSFIEDSLPALMATVTLPTLEQLHAVYRNETKLEPVAGEDCFSIVRVEAVGAYSELLPDSLKTSLISWLEIEAAWRRLAGILCAKPARSRRRLALRSIGRCA